MTDTFGLARRAARFRLPVLATFLTLTFGACDNSDLTDPIESAGPAAAPETPTEAVPDQSLASINRRGMPFGNYHQPTEVFGASYNGALRNIAPNKLLLELAAIRARGGRVVLMFAGNERNYKDRSGHFSLSMWKARIDRMKGINFTPFINDGTVIGHFLIDEPNDPHNWNGRPLSGATLEAMAKYSKSRWPTMATIVRVRPDYLAKFKINYHYLDAAVAQYHSRFGNPSTFLAVNVAQAKKVGLGLLVGFNLLHGNAGRRMTPSQIRSWGAALMGNSYTCAFISWKYDAYYLANGAIKDAMKYLRSKAQVRSLKSCKGAG